MGTAEILPFSDKIAQDSFMQGPKIVKMNLKEVPKMENGEEGVVFIKIIPNGKLFCYGVGYSLMELRKNIEAVVYSVVVPPERL